MVRPHHKLDVWRKSLDLVKQVYEVTSLFPSDEKFGLASQMRRAAVSIPSNVAEGAALNSHKQFIHFLHTAQGSAAELETQIFISQELGFLTERMSKELLEKLETISKMISGIQRSLKS